MKLRNPICRILKNPGNIFWSEHTEEGSEESPPKRRNFDQGGVVGGGGDEGAGEAAQTLERNQPVPLMMGAWDDGVEMGWNGLDPWRSPFPSMRGRGWRGRGRGRGRAMRGRGMRFMEGGFYGPPMMGMGGMPYYGERPQIPFSDEVRYF